MESGEPVVLKAAKVRWHPPETEAASLLIQFRAEGLYRPIGNRFPRHRDFAAACCARQKEQDEEYSPSHPTSTRSMVGCPVNYGV